MSEDETRPAPKYKIWMAPDGEYRLSINGGVDALDGQILWLRGSDRSFPDLAAAMVGLKRLITKPQWFYDEQGHEIPSV